MFFATSMNEVGGMGEAFAALSGILIVYGVILLIASAVGLVLFILQGMGLHKMSKALGLNNPWIGFIPVVSYFSLGRIASKYVKRDGSPSAKFQIWLLVLYILTYVLLIVFFAIFIVAMFTLFNTVTVDSTAVDSSIFTAFIPVIILYFVTMAVAITFEVIYYIALWRIFAIFDSNNSTLFTILSIFFGFLTPIFLLIISKKQPKLTYNERMGFEATEIL